MHPKQGVQWVQDLLVDLPIGTDVVDRHLVSDRHHHTSHPLAAGVGIHLHGLVHVVLRGGCTLRLFCVILVKPDEGMIRPELLVEPLPPVLVVHTRDWDPITAGLQRVHNSWKPRFARVGVDEHFAALDDRQRFHGRQRSEQLAVCRQLFLHPLPVYIVLGHNFVAVDLCDLPVAPPAGAGRVNLHLLTTLVHRDFLLSPSSLSSSRLRSAPHRGPRLLVHIVRPSSGVPQLAQLLLRLRRRGGRLRLSRGSRRIRVPFRAGPRRSERRRNLLGHRKISNAHAHVSVIGLLDSGSLRGHSLLVLLGSREHNLGHLLMLDSKCRLVLLRQLLHPGVQLRRVSKGCRPGCALYQQTHGGHHLLA
mmetsp:Transcript_45552/g.120347  ORF Transcript_45552/g.120347 Transcript_45552/m.120347 type:complete len:362 (-) Transcript_45552:178-1263(-)